MRGLLLGGGDYPRERLKNSSQVTGIFGLQSKWLQRTSVHKRQTFLQIDAARAGFRSQRLRPWSECVNWKSVTQGSLIEAKLNKIFKRLCCSMNPTRSGHAAQFSLSTPSTLCHLSRSLHLDLHPRNSFGTIKSF